MLYENYINTCTLSIIIITKTKYLNVKVFKLNNTCDVQVFDLKIFKQVFFALLTVIITSS